MDLAELSSPVLLLDEAKCRSNMERMHQKAKQHNLEFRPHFKTHQSAEIGSWFRSIGVTGITVSSVPMASYFADSGWTDITIAFPVNPREIGRINKLAARIEKLNLLVAEPEIISVLDHALSNAAGLYIEIDTGAGRSGFLPGEHNTLDQLLDMIDKSEMLNTTGFYSHPGHSYRARSREQLHSIHRDVLSAMQSLRQTYSNLACCIGDTPCCSTADDFSGIDQISPGNFVFYDCMQRQIGSCRTEDIAVALAVPVVARYPGRRELIVHGGAIHLSREALDWQSQQGNETMYGLVTRLGDKCWSEPVEGAFVSALSQEHGVITGPSSLVESVKPGDLLGVLPVHSCLTANLAPNYHLLQKNTVIDCMP